MSFFYKTFVEFVIDLDRGFYKALQCILSGSVLYKLVFNVVLKSSVVHSAKRVVVLFRFSGVFPKFGGILGY